jgi:transcriptional regulator with XRE-family HTH domain
MSHARRLPPGWNVADFSQRLRQLRVASKVTQTRVAGLPGISPSVYTRWESGDAHIHTPELRRLYKKVDQLPDEDQKALMIVLDSSVKRSEVSQVMAEP